MSISEKDLKNAINEYTNFKYNGKEIHISYYISPDNGPYGGKSTVEQITDYIDDNFSGKMSELQAWVDNHQVKTGMDCSGFVYNVLQKSSDTDLKDIVGKTAGNTNAKRLANLNNKYISEVDNAFNVKPGDVIYFDGHIAVIYEVKKKNSNMSDGNGNPLQVPYLIRYAHSCPHKINGKDAGPHLAKIYVDKPFESLDKCGTWSDLDDTYPGEWLIPIFKHVARLEL